MNLSIGVELEVALHQYGPLNGKRGRQEVKDHTTEAVETQEGQQAAEADEDHDLHICKVGIIPVEGVIHGIGLIVLKLGVGIVVVGHEARIQGQEHHL